MNLIDWIINIFKTRQSDIELNDNDFANITGFIVEEEVRKREEA